MDFNIFFKNSKQKYNISHFDLSYVIYKVLGLNRTEQLKCENISEADIKLIENVLDQYLNGKPLNKIFNEQNFYGLDFYIDENVLAPRPETEILVEKAINEIRDNNYNVLDLCTGSGCIGITIKHKCKNALVTLSDISQKALQVAKINAKKFDTDVNIILSDLFTNIPKQRFDFILSNPPYIKNGNRNTLSKEVLMYDPDIALFGGDDGLDFYRRILKESEDYLSENGKIIFEIGYDICLDTVSLAQNFGFNTTIIKDYNGIDRVLVLYKGEKLC